MNNTVMGFLIACVLVGIVYFVFRGSIHIGPIVNGIDSILVVKFDTVRVSIPIIKFRDRPAKIDTVLVYTFPNYSVDSNIVRASLDTVFQDGKYSDSLHISYLEGIHIWEDIWIKIQERSQVEVDSSYRVHTVQTFYETSWTWTAIFVAFAFILGILN